MKKYTITNMDRLKALKAVQREICQMPKPMVTKDKKKEANKKACRGKVSF
jgi:hypothetical protein